jgi:hypothetical protein
MDKSNKMRWSRYVASIGKMRNAYKILDGNPEGKKPLGRPNGRGECNIKKNLEKKKL